MYKKVSLSRIYKFERIYGIVLLLTSYELSLINPFQLSNIMTTSRGFTTNDLRNGINFNNLDDMQPPMRRLSPIDLRSDNPQYPRQEIRNGDKYQNFEP
jgi:hypothetical protein